MDATYKLTVLGFPLLVLGTQDIKHKFRLIALAISRHEKESDFKFMIEGVKHSLEGIYEYNWKVDLIMADGSHQIYQAARSIFGDSFTHEMCSVHLWRNLEKKNCS